MSPERVGRVGCVGFTLKKEEIRRPGRTGQMIDQLAVRPFGERGSGSRPANFGVGIEQGLLVLDVPDLSSEPTCQGGYGAMSSIPAFQIS